MSVSTLQVQRALIQQPISSPARLVERTGLTQATVNKCIGHLEKLGIVTELTSRNRNRLFSYLRYVEIMSKGAELPERLFYYWYIARKDEMINLYSFGKISLLKSLSSCSLYRILLKN